MYYNIFVPLTLALIFMNKSYVYLGSKLNDISLSQEVKCAQLFVKHQLNKSFININKCKLNMRLHDGLEFHTNYIIP